MAIRFCKFFGKFADRLSIHELVDRPGDPWEQAPHAPKLHQLVPLSYRGVWGGYLG